MGEPFRLILALDMQGVEGAGAGRGATFSRVLPLTDEETRLLVFDDSLSCQPSSSGRQAESQQLCNVSRPEDFPKTRQCSRRRGIMDMNGFTIEASAETNPFNPESLVQTLHRAASNNVGAIQSGTKQLQHWETTGGYYSALQDVFLQSELPLDIRLLALIQLKNGIDKYWRKSATNAISPNERLRIRDRLLQSSLHEPVDRLASMNSIVTAKVARHDFPGKWQDLIPQLLELVKTSAHSNSPQKTLSRALLVSHHVIKELATVRLQRPRASLLSAAPDMFRVLRDCYFFKVQQWQKIISSNSAALDLEAMRAMDASEQTLKILRRLIIAGYDFPHRHNEICDFWGVSASHVQMYLQMLHQQDLQNAYRISASQHVKQLAKLHLTMSREHAVSFALLPNTTDLVRSYWAAAKELRSRQLSGEEMEDDMFQVYNTFNLRAILILRACFKEAYSPSQPFKYRNSDGKDEPPRAKKLFTDKLLDHAFVGELFHTLLNNFFIYLNTDVEEFVSEPEEWDMKDEGDEEAYEKSVRAASERLFMDICIHHKNIVIEPLLKTVASVAGPIGAPLVKDAIYAAIGVAAPILNTRFDFNTFLVTSLREDMHQKEQAYSIVRRRIAIVLAKWMPINIVDSNRPLVYEIFQTLLNNRLDLNNLAVRITAGKRLHDVVDEITFKPDDFVPYAANILGALLDLIKEVETAETKLALLNTVSTIVERMEVNASNFANQIIEILQTLWNYATSENMMKTTIVTILSKLVRSMKAESGNLHGVMLDIIRDALQPDSDSQVYLLDDALDLWLAILKHTQAPPSTELLSLVAFLFHLYELDDSMQKSLAITRSCILLAPSEMLQDNIRGKLFESFLPLLSARDTKISFAALENIDLMIRASDALGGEQAVQLVTKDLMQTSLLYHMMDSLNMSWESRQTTGPKRKDPPSDWKNETDYLVILSRIVLLNTQAFLTAVTSFAESKQLSLKAWMSRLLDECFSHMDAVGRPTDGKLICLGVTKLLETGQPWILEKLQDLMALWTSMIVELRDGDNDKSGDSLVYRNPGLPSGDVPEDLRTHAVTYSDPVHTINLGEYVRHHLRSVIARTGGDELFQETWLANVDKDVVKAFGESEIL